MSIENPTTPLQEEPKASLTDEEIQNTKSNMEMSKKLRQVNDILQVLDFPDNQEEAFRVILEKQEPKTLQELATKSKKEILTFLVLENKKEVTKTVTEENIKWNIIDSKKALENQKIQTKLSKIKAVFTPTILENNPDIAEKLEILEGLDEPLEKEKVLKDILQILKNHWRLKAIIDNLGGADRSNPHYVEFKSALLGLDSGFEEYFKDLENINLWESLSADDVVESVEWDSGGMIEIDLGGKPPVSKMSLIWSDYSFDEELDKKALSKLLEESKGELMAVQNSFTILEGLYKPFDVLLKSIRKIWWNPDFKASLKDVVSGFTQDIFSSLESMYEDMGIKWDMQIHTSDIASLWEFSTSENMMWKIQSIKDRFIKMKSHLWSKKAWIHKEYKADVEALVTRGTIEKKRELEVLEFMHSSGYDLFPKKLTNRIIKELMSGMLIIPWLDLSIKNIDLKNGNFWESSVFIDKGNGLNIEAKRNLVKFVNKMINWNTNEPLNVKSIASGVVIVDPLELKHMFVKADINDGLGWKYSKILKNLRTK